MWNFNSFSAYVQDLDSFFGIMRLCLSNLFKFMGWALLGSTLWVLIVLLVQTGWYVFASLQLLGTSQFLMNLRLNSYGYALFP